MELLHSLVSNVGLLELIGFVCCIIFFAARLENATNTNKEIISTEISHVLKLMEINHQNLKDDIDIIKQLTQKVLDIKDNPEAAIKNTFGYIKKFKSKLINLGLD